MLPRQIALLGLGACGAVAQYLSMKTCSDASCGSVCVSWRINAGECATCNPDWGACSYSNPSAVTTLSSIQYYYDRACLDPIPNSSASLTFDGQCHVIGDYRGYIPGGTSYVALDISAVIGGVVGGLLLLVVVAVAILCVCRTSDGGVRRCGRAPCPCCVGCRACGAASRTPPAPPIRMILVPVAPAAA